MPSAPRIAAISYPKPTLESVMSSTLQLKEAVEIMAGMKNFDAGRMARYEELVAEAQRITARFNELVTLIVAAEGDISILEAAVAALETDVTALQTAVSTLQTDMTTAKADIITVESDIAVLEADMVDAEDAIVALQALPPGWRNRIINGDFVVDQRNNGAAVAVSSAGPAHVLDRWEFSFNATGTISVGRYDIDGEFSIIFSVATPDASIGAADIYLFGQRIEGYNFRDALWGTANAKPVTVSFWLNSTIAGTFSFLASNFDGSRTYLTSFTVPAGVNTKISFTIPGDTTGTWNDTNGTGLNVFVGLAVGTTYQGVSGWQAGAKYGLPGMTNFMAAGNQFIFHKFQVELGSVATEFERVPYNEQLARCQRYYEQIAGTAASSFEVIGCILSGDYAAVSTRLMPKRAVPTSTVSSAADFLVRIYGGAGVTGLGSVTTSCTVEGVTSVVVFKAAGFGASQGFAGLHPTNANARLRYSAEL